MINSCVNIENVTTVLSLGSAVIIEKKRKNAWRRYQ